MPNRLDLIKDYIDYIKRSPKEMKWFFIDNKHPRAFVMSGHRLKLLPLEYAKYYNSEEFYVHVNVDNQDVMYCAWDESFVAHIGGEEHTNQSEGHMDWHKVEDTICNFLTTNMKELTTATTPFADMAKLRTPYSEMGKIPGTGDGEISDRSNYRPMHGPMQHRTVDRAPTEKTDNVYYSYKPDFAYGSAEYKERDAFVNQITSFMKDGKTTSAIESISDTFEHLNNEKRFTMMDSILTNLTFDKLNIPTIIALLRKTREADVDLKKRKDFSEKVKTHLVKIRATRASAIVAEIESG